MSLKSGLKKLKRIIGPGVITGGSDNDPAGIVTYTTVGSLFGYSLSWFMVLITPLMVVLQEMAGRVAIIQKKGLAKIIKENYGVRIAFFSVFILVIANIATIAADLAGVSAVLGILFEVNFLFFIIPVALLVSGIILFENYKRFKSLLLFLTLLLVLYIFSALFSKPDWEKVLIGFIPDFKNSTIFLGAIIGVIGTTISPYMLFWQASEEVEEHKRILKPRELEIDTIIGMSWSNIVAIFIIIAAGATLFKNGIQVDTVESAALALAPIAGHWAFLLFSIGIISSGLLALPILSGSTAYAVAEIFNWKEGINKKLHLAKGFYFVILLSIFIGSLIAFIPISPVLFLYYTQILNGFLTPFLIIILLILSNSKKIVGKNKSGWIKNLIGITSFFIIVTLDVFLIMDLLNLSF